MNHFYSEPIKTTTRQATPTFILGICLVLLLSFSFSNSLHAQLVPQLVFQNPELISGTDKANNAVYRFSNVTTGIDALVAIEGRSSGSVSLTNLDVTSSGSNNAFQPQVNFVGNNSNRNWYMDFSIHFVAAGTRNELPDGSGIIYKVTALDVDGDNSRIREYIQAFGASSYQVDANTQLTVSSVTSTINSVSYSGTQFLGPITNYTDIDINAPRVAATLSYNNQNTIQFRVGARNTTGTSSSASARYSSLLFNNFLYIAPAPLPVDLISFTAKLNKKVAVLDWVTANEIDFSHFIIQRSADGSSFEDIATVAGKQSNGSSNTSYSYTDNTDIPNAIVYYRLKMVDIDGKFKYSEIEIVNGTKAQNQSSVLVYPNPASSELRVTIPNNWQGKTISYTIYNSNGGIVSSKQINNAGQTELFKLSGIAAGLYTIRIKKDAETIIKQFVKQN